MSGTLPFVHALTMANPALAALFEAHLAQNGEPLPHVFMGDVCRYVLEQYQRLQRGDVEAKEILPALFTQIEDAFADGDTGLKELISVSFLENLAVEFADEPRLRAFLGPELGEELSLILAWGYPPDVL